MNVFELKRQLVADYREYVQSFLRISDERISTFVKQQLDSGAYWPEALVQLNPTFEPGESIMDLIRQGVLHEECQSIFRIKTQDKFDGPLLSLHRHQTEAIRIASNNENYIVTTGTGSGKSLTYILPIVNHILKNGSGKGTKAIIIYPMNALANSQKIELEKFLELGYPAGQRPVTFARYTGQEKEDEREQIRNNPPDILLTNYVMADLLLTRIEDRHVLGGAQNLRFLVLDELHTYRGRQGADVALLVRRLKDRLDAPDVICVGTSATMSSTGTLLDQKRTVAEVASRLFGSEVKPENVIGETLRRTTEPFDEEDPVQVRLLAERIRSGRDFSHNFEGFIADPLARWVEGTLGLRLQEGRLTRQVPQPISGPEGTGRKLSLLTGESQTLCEQAIQKCLLAGYQTFNPNTKLRAFAFRLHQFVSRGDTVYATLEDEFERYLTIQAQQFKPGERDKVLMPLAFCRECGQEHYTVWRKPLSASSKVFIPRSLQDKISEPGAEPGFLYLGDWPDDEQGVLERLPDDYVESDGLLRMLRKDARKRLPEKIFFYLDGREVESHNKDPELRVGHYLKSPLPFCPNCGVAYSARMKNDFAKLSTLSSEGRSTATTILSLSTVLRLKETDLSDEAKKLLSFTDNRQDASLQAGHLNDFVETGLLRAAIYKAVSDAGEEGLTHDELTQAVFRSLSLPLSEYASNPEVKFAQKHETEKALRDVLGYRIYRDLKRGWRITAPNLEQVDLLRIEYMSLSELAAATEEWQGKHSALVAAPPELRERILCILLDLMRRSLAIKVDYLDKNYQERLAARSSQYLVAPWSIDENEKLEFSSIVYPRSRQRGDSGELTFLSSRSAFGQYLRKASGLTSYYTVTVEDSERVIKDLLDVLCVAGIVEKVDDQHGYQVLSSALIWKPGKGLSVQQDPLRVRTKLQWNTQVNDFFKTFYTLTARNLVGVEAKEHTAQVPAELRMEREEDFRAGTLPIMYCSPTMELGVDISTLNVVGLRNVPPTPANYAQRSGRAGRSGQPALVFTYASTGNSHDAFFFRRPARMVQGVVNPPRIDLGNEDLLRSHIQAIWISETKVKLGRTLKDVLDLNGENPSLKLLDHVKDAINNEKARLRAMVRAERVMESLSDELKNAQWYHPNWLADVLRQAPDMLDQACNRWRELYRSARAQIETANKIILDASRSTNDKNQAKALRAQAESQIELLQENNQGNGQGDFSSYRFFASEGFLPGYSFPRLPLSAFISARRKHKTKEDALSRPRFLAITEFGPHSVLYFEGNKYVINKVLLSPGAADELQTQLIKRCEQCGYLHEVDAVGGPDVCQHCKTPLGVPLKSLLRMTNVGTQRRERISSDEEERVRLGYEVLTAVRFPKSAQNPSQTATQTAEVYSGDVHLASLSYAQATDIWRINLGWRQRTNLDVLGFLLDQERGYWIKDSNNFAPDDANEQIMQGRKTARVIPFVQDRKNSLLYQPRIQMDETKWATLMAALKIAVQLEYQLEDNELAAELLPNSRTPQHILLYEAAEGGAGVLRQVVTDPQAIARVARQALELCHFDPITGQDEHHSKHSTEDCESACYDCLMSYSNQWYHRQLDRYTIKPYLMDLTMASVQSSPTEQPRDDHFSRLERLCESELEKRFLRFLRDNGLALPSDAQKYIPECNTRLDFSYEKSRVAIYVDGPPHDYLEHQARDEQCTDCLMWEMGYNVIRFHHEADWFEIVKAHPNIFGVTQKA
ncbi:DEAD/DEAH box helicase [Deinococcus roseus]|uniref:RNA helicase n=1 Tax=Deinococcus roseus TaxID=392414 RepID=A0ABQ2CWC7_9DEIO|nr:DEAD/DEAH box helicase [Deinococcus roseus]GGJ23520.1 RNA helicase [Deinococcus roseus]